VDRYLIQAKLGNPEPFLQLLDCPDSRPGGRIATDEESLSSLISFAHLPTKFPKDPPPWQFLGQRHASAFCHTMARLRQMWFDASQARKKWVRCASRPGCAGGRWSMETVFQATVQIMGVEKGFSGLPLGLSQELARTGILAPDKTLLAVRAKSFVETAEAAAFLVFWQIVRLELRLSSCDHCHSTFVVGKRKRFCTAVCGRRFYADLRKASRAHWRNHNRILVTSGVLNCWAMRPLGHWQNVVLEVWHQHEQSLSAAGNDLQSKADRLCSWKPRYSPFLKLCREAAYELTFHGPKEQELLRLCTPPPESYRDPREFCGEMELFLPVLKSLFRTIRRCDEIQLALGQERLLKYNGSRSAVFIDSRLQVRK